MSRSSLFAVLLSLGVTSAAEAQWIYWEQYSQAQDTTTIRRANLDGTNVEVVATGAYYPGTRATPQAVVVDGRGGKVYWVTQDNLTIRRSNLDGSNPEDVLTQAHDGLDGPFIIAIVYPALSNIPAVSTFGLGVLALLVVGAGAYVMRKRLLSAPLTGPQRGTPGA